MELALSSRVRPELGPSKSTGEGVFCYNLDPTCPIMPNNWPGHGGGSDEVWSLRYLSGGMKRAVKC
jgi:hypothetical protein